MSTPAERLSLISVNDHLIEPPDLWSGDPRLPHLDGDRWVIGSSSLSIPQLSVLAHDLRRPAASYADMHPAAWQPAPRLAAMDTDGVAIQLLMPHAIGFAGERLAAIGDIALWERACRAYNSYLLHDFCAADPARLLGVAIVPFGDIDRAVREVERAAAAGARAVSLPHDLPFLADAEASRLFDALGAHELPIFVHVGSAGGPVSVVGQHDPAALLLRGSLDAAHAAIALVCSGVLGHPALKVAFIEAGVGWFAYLVERVRFFARQRPEVVHPRAADALIEQCYVSYIDDTQATGSRHELWQSDFPHADSTWPHSRERVPADLAEVANANARRLFGGIAG